MLRAACIILFISLVGPLQRVISQDVPYIACPQYFQYLRSQIDGSYVGKIMIPNVSIGLTAVDVEFSLRVPLRGYFGRIVLDEDKESIANKISNNQPINYRVEFPIQNVLPKLTALNVNGKRICSASEYPGFPSKISLQYNLTTWRTYNTNENQQRIPEHPTTYKPQGQVCGQERTDTTLIHGGIIIARGQFPWLAAIFKKIEADSRKFYCSGSLISSRTVLTAAHCIKMAELEPKNIAVQLGRYNLSVSNEKHVLEVNIQTVHMNPDYDDVNVPDADLALLLLDTTVVFTHLLHPICLWSESDDESLIVSLTGYVAGWGGDENGNDLSPLPKMAPAKIVSETQCLRSSEKFNSITSSRTFCAGQQDGVGPCMGDSGGGFMLKRKGLWTLRGVVSMGQTRIEDNKSQCDLRHYVVYCDVAKHKNWVQKNML